MPKKVANDTERFVVISNGEVIGEVVVRTDGLRLEVDYAVDENGRGAKLREEIRLDADGLPVDWQVDGTSLMGGAVHELMTYADDRQTWSSQADHGEVVAAAPLLYIANDSSPIACALYARAALDAGGSVDVLPSGTLHIRPVRSVQLGGATVDAYSLTGVGLLPEFVLLDKDGQLVARLGGDLSIRQFTVREDHAEHQEAIAALDLELSVAYLSAAQQRIRHRFDRPVRIRNVRVFDPASSALTPSTSVTFFRGTITAVGDTGTTDHLVEIDGQGGTLLAGLHDMHAHNSPWTGLFYLAAGVTTTRDMGNDNEALLDLRRQLAAGALDGPSIVASGLIEGRSPFSARLGIIPQTRADAVAAVRWYAHRGYHQIKIYNSMNPEWVAELTAEAHRLGLRAVGHVPAFATPDQMIEAGYDEITHINQLMLGWLLDPDEDTRTPLRLTAMARAKDLDLDGPRVRHTIELMKARGTGLDTTVVILERLMGGRAGRVHPGDAPMLSHLPIGYQRYRRRTFVPATTDDELRAYDEAFPKLLEAIGLLHREGVQVWPGTDDGTGFTLHRELELYVAAGIRAGEVLRIATRDCAEHLGRGHHTGTIARGNDADLVLVHGDPVTDISAVRAVRMVVRGGDVYFPAEIYRELGIEPFASPPPVSDPGEVSTAVREPVARQVEGVFGGLSVGYTAAVRELVVPDENGAPAARVVATEYVGTDAGPGRPVAFVCNGGPIAPSTALHLGAFGPRRIAVPEDLYADPSTFETVDNEYALLDAADLVFFDPAGTGYSRVLDGVDPGTYYSVHADAQQMTAWIETWLRAHDRRSAPVYLIGESYGTMRVALVAKRLTELADEPVNLAGVVFVGQALNMIETSSGRRGNVMGPVVSLPTLAAVAWHHGKIDRIGQTLDEVIEAAFAFARLVYLPALVRGPGLPDSVRSVVAAGLASLTGVPAADWISRDLRLPKNEFRSELLKDQNLVLSLYDGRFASAPMADLPDTPMAKLSTLAHGNRVPVGESAIHDALAAATVAHLKEFIGADWPDEYRTTQPPAESDGEEWAWSDSTSPFGDWPYVPALSDAMTQAPGLRAFFATGKHDLSTTIGATEHAVATSGWPSERVTVRHYDGGHLMYTVKATLRALSNDLRHFLRSAQ